MRIIPYCNFRFFTYMPVEQYNPKVIGVKRLNLVAYTNSYLLANEPAVGPILQFLRNTEVGSRDGTRGRELEWQRRSDQEGENQLTD